MSKREIIQAAISGAQPDALPYSFWTHLPGIDLDPVRLADETYDFYRKYDIDFIKTMNNGMYAIEDFGCEIDYSAIAQGGVAKGISTPVQNPEDWYKLSPLSITQGSLARELHSLKLLLKRTKKEKVPVIFTVFSPLTTANKITNQLSQHIHEGFGETVHHALRVITETTCNLVQAALDLGADGVFFAMQHSNYGFMTAKEYEQYGVPYDLEVLNAAQGGWMNTIHAHGDDIMAGLLKDYPAQVFNWHVWETYPAMEEASCLMDKCLMGGLNRNSITQCNYNAIQNQIFECCRLLGGRKHILTPGCVIRYPLDTEMLAYIKQAKDFVESRLLKK